MIVGCVVSLLFVADKDGLKAQKHLAQGSALGKSIIIKVALKGQKL